MSSLGAYLIETSITLFAVIALAFLVLYGARKVGVGRAAGPLELVGRLPIDARRAIYLVRVGKLVYVVGASEGGLTKLGELGAEGVAASEAEPSPRFADLLARTLGQKPAVESATQEGPHA